MSDDPRIKRVLKRYPKDSTTPDAAIELDGITTASLQAALGVGPEDPLFSPCELSWPAIEFFHDQLGIELDSGAFDYFLHTYVRRESVKEYYADKSRPEFPGGPAPEGGPPVPAPPGKRWYAVRPKDGKEHFEQWDE